MIKLENLNKNYNSIPIYKDTNYTFKDCALTCFFIVPSSSGKTTLLKLIAGVDTNYSGTIKNNYVCLNTMSTNQLCNYSLENIGFVFQNL